jgi:YfiH family protein
VFSLGSLGGGVRYAFTSRAGGHSEPPYDSLNLSFGVGDDPIAVERNRKLVLERLGVPDAVWLRARHGSGVIEVGGDDAGERPTPPEVDALVTRVPRLAVASLSADCLLVALADPRAGVVATAHCGRPGLTAGIVAATVAAMRDAGATEIRAALGPSVCGACYEVPQAMADDVCAVVPAARARSSAGTPALDIAAGVAAQLAEQDVEIVRRVSGCTREDPSLYSYRRDSVTGRQAAVVWLDR